MMSALRRWSFGPRNLVGSATIDEAIDRSQLGFEVEKVPAHTKVMDGVEAGRYEVARNAFVIRRTDNRDALGIVGNRYSPVQNAAVVDALRPLFDQGLVAPESGDIFDGGSTGFMAFSMDVEKVNRISNGRTEELFGEVMPFFLLTLSHDGSSSNRILQVPERISCMNQLPGIMSGASIVIRHTGAAEEKMQLQADKLFSGLVNKYVEYAALYDLLRFEKMTMDAFEKLILDVALPLGKRPPEPTNRWLNERERQERRRLDVEARWMDGSGHKGDHSVWEALNGMVECMDHDELFNKRGNSLKSNVQGVKMRTKNRLLAGVTRYAKTGAYLTN